MTQDITTGAAGPQAEPVQPRGGAGIFDVDPAQAALPQGGAVPALGDLDHLPEDLEF